MLVAGEEEALLLLSTGTVVFAVAFSSVSSPRVAGETATMESGSSLPLACRAVTVAARVHERPWSGEYM